MDIPYDEEENKYRTPSRSNDDEPPRKETLSKTIEVSAYGGFWLRVWAYLLDLIVVASVNGLLISPVFIFMDGDPSVLSIFTIQGILTSIMAYVYFVLMTKFLGQTLGKMAFGLRVVRKDGNKVTWGEVFTREVPGRMIHRVLIVTNLMYIVVGVHPEKAGVHDMLADTRVIRDNGEPDEDEEE